jgi:hypothetical protein
VRKPTLEHRLKTVGGFGPPQRHDRPLISNADRRLFAVWRLDQQWRAGKQEVSNWTQPLANIDRADCVTGTVTSPLAMPTHACLAVDSAADTLVFVSTGVPRLAGWGRGSDRPAFGQ